MSKNKSALPLDYYEDGKLRPAFYLSTPMIHHEIKYHLNEMRISAVSKNAKLLELCQWIMDNIEKEAPGDERNARLLELAKAFFGRN